IKYLVTSLAIEALGQEEGVDSEGIELLVEVCVDCILEQHKYLHLPKRMRPELVAAVVAEVDGFGPIQPLLDDSTVSEVMVNGTPLDMDRLVKAGALTEDVAHFLACAVKMRLNLIISGGTGSGKTTLLNALSGGIPDHERIVTIEDSAELRLQVPHVVSLES